MRRFLFALALSPLSCLAQSVVVNPGAGAPPPTTEQVGAYRGMGNAAMDASGPALGGDARVQINPASAGSAADRERAQQIAAAQPAGAPTASAQGYQASSSAASLQALADYQAAHTPRQLGQRVRQPAPLDPVAGELRSQGWLANWSATLVRAGVPETKVNFEARRLDREAFAAWAHRQILFIHTTP